MQFNDFELEWSCSRVDIPRVSFFKWIVSRRRAAKDRRQTAYTCESQNIRTDWNVCVRNMSESVVCELPTTLHRAVSFDPSVRYRRMECFQVSSNTITSVSSPNHTDSMEMCQLLVCSEYWWSEVSLHIDETESWCHSEGTTTKHYCKPLNRSKKWAKKRRSVRAYRDFYDKLPVYSADVWNISIKLIQ